MVKSKPPSTIDEYIAGFPDDIQAILQKIKATIKKAAPDATEKISYQIPAFALNGDLVYFAAFKRHIGFYPPIRGGDATFRQEKAIYEGPKGNLQFPLGQPIPYPLIRKIVALRLAQNLARTSAKKPRT
jgi:uncharacterized protein YdhG (YjbR/CyaY superfamily)